VRCFYPRERGESRNHTETHAGIEVAIELVVGEDGFLPEPLTPARRVKSLTLAGNARATEKSAGIMM